MTRMIRILAIASASLLTTASFASATDVILGVGAPGAPEFGERFETASRLWTAAAKTGGASAKTVRKAADFKAAVAEAVKKETEGPLWIVLIGHGTFDEREAKFNFEGPDITATELATALKDNKRTVAVINTSASSAPFIQRLKGSNRIVMTATKSGAEESYAHFGQYLAEGIGDVENADIDNDGAVSLLEAFIYASRQTAEFFEGEGRIATEQALLDDNGDGFGTPADWFQGIRAVKKPKKEASPDGFRAHQLHLIPSPEEASLTAEQRAERDKLELAVLNLRDKKSTLKEDEFYKQLEQLLLKLAKIYDGAPSDS